MRSFVLDPYRLNILTLQLDRSIERFRSRTPRRREDPLDRESHAGEIGTNLPKVSSLIVQPVDQDDWAVTGKIKKIPRITREDSRSSSWHNSPSETSSHQVVSDNGSDLSWCQVGCHPGHEVGINGISTGDGGDGKEDKSYGKEELHGEES